jgi:hypothetical protein
MTVAELCLPPDDESPLAQSGCVRTIAAFHLAQGHVGELSQQEMRRDVLVALIAPWRRGMRSGAPGYAKEASPPLARR